MSGIINQQRSGVDSFWAQKFDDVVFNHMTGGMQAAHSVHLRAHEDQGRQG